ncbi:hypothetical protein [Thermoplasma volcanium]|uniref:hypothetical protein n=1 Tax=Thermoplasma volcanium TaxID=50339 RepID=UPI0012EAD85D|nr:hypothetical protein [Thermoplasma volcanium]
MNSLLKKATIIIVAVAVIVPAAYFAIQLNNKSSESSDPLYYVPSSSEAIGYINVNNTRAYFFYSNNSLALVINTGSMGGTLNFTGHLSDKSSSNKTSNLKLYESFMGNNIYMISNLSFSMYSFTIRNVTFYAYESNGFIVIGNLSAVKYSIEASIKGNNAISMHSSLNTSANISLYIHPLNSTVLKYAYANVSGQNLTATISFTNYTEESYFLSIILSFKSIKVREINNLTVKISGTLPSKGEIGNILGTLHAE